MICTSWYLLVSDRYGTARKNTMRLQICYELDNQGMASKILALLMTAGLFVKLKMSSKVLLWLKVLKVERMTSRLKRKNVF